MLLNASIMKLFKFQLLCRRQWCLSAAKFSSVSMLSSSIMKCYREALQKKIVSLFSSSGVKHVWSVLCSLSCRPRLKNVDRSSAQHLEVTVGDLTVIITDFKEKTKPSSSSSSSAASGDHHSQSGSNSDNTEKGISRSSSPRGEGSSLNGESH